MVNSNPTRAYFWTWIMKRPLEWVIGHCSKGLASITPMPAIMFANGFFMLLFDLTPDQGASEAHTSHPEQGNIRVELKFAKPLPEAITCLLYLVI